MIDPNGLPTAQRAATPGSAFAASVTASMILAGAASCRPGLSEFEHGGMALPAFASCAWSIQP